MNERPAHFAEPCFAFGAFRLLPEQHLLLEGETPVRIGSRALDILSALVERPGELVRKDELIARVWPNVVVEEINLRVNVAALRKVLGDGRAGRRYVANVPGRGYSFVAQVDRYDSVRKLQPNTAAHNLPNAPTQTIGRTERIEAIRRQLPQHRLFTIVGPGGIGKTAVALAVAVALIMDYRHGVWLVDLSPLHDAKFVPSALATVLGLTIHAENVVDGLMIHLRDKEMLIVLDSCEHFIEAAAFLAEQIIGCAPGVHVLATSREPLRAKGEHVHRLSPLSSPPAGSSGLTAGRALSFPAVQLFVERAAASRDGFELTDADTSAASWTGSRGRSNWRLPARTFSDFAKYCFSSTIGFEC